MSDHHPLIWVDLIEDHALDQSDWYEREGGVTAEGNFFESDDAVTAAYRDYLDKFQPWRLLIKSGDNHEPLFRSTESYFNRADAIHAAELAFGGNSNVYLRAAETGNVALRMASGGS